MGCISGCDARDDRTVGDSSGIISGNTQQSDPPGSLRSGGIPGDHDLDDDDRPTLIHRRRRQDDSFEAFAEELQRELAPRSLLERVLADRVVLSAWTLHSAGVKERAAIRSRPGLEDCEDLESSAPRSRSRGRVKASAQDVFFVAHCLEKSVDLLRRLLDEDQPRGGRPDPAGTTPASRAAAVDVANDPDDADLIDDDPSDFSNEWPFVSRGRSVESHQEDEAPTEDPKLARRWQDRLIFDVNVSEHSPVVKGTWITVSHVVSLIVDGWTWSDILRTHPELNVDDIRTCLAYTVAEGNGDT